MMKIKIFFVMLFFVLCAPLVRADDIQFRLVLTPKEAQRTPHHVYEYNSRQKLLVSDEALLTKEDVENLGIVKGTLSVREKGQLVIYFNQQGRVKVRYLTTKRYPTRQLALFWDNELIEAPFLTNAIENGRMVIVSARFIEKDFLEKMIKSLGFAPYLENSLVNKRDERDAYRFVIYAMKEKKRDIAQKMIIRMYRFDPDSKYLIKLFKMYPSLKGIVPDPIEGLVPINLPE